MSVVERFMSRTLFWGGVLGICLMLLGLVGFAARSQEAQNITRLTENRQAVGAVGGFTSVLAVRRGLETRPMDPLAVTAVGMLLLLVTPVLAVVAAIPAFLAAGDVRYAAIAALLTAILVGSLLAGGGG